MTPNPNPKWKDSMKTPTSKPPASFRVKLAQQLQAGNHDSKDPKNAGIPALAARTTTIYSPWCIRTCSHCGLDFREGDRVRLCPKCRRAYHDDPQLHLRCWPHHFRDGRVCRPPRRDPQTRRPDPNDPGCPYTWDGHLPDAAEPVAERPADRPEGIIRAFLAGLEGSWTAFGDAEVILVQPDDHLVGLKCPWCRYLIRAGDRVVKCPCGRCDTYFHEDVYHRLTCWSEWNGAQGHDFCPTTLAKIEKPAPESADPEHP
jgi:hypothetical protein